ncbi:MAG TPA: helix-turn-helix transcriptional regulator [Acidimicrobiales bacterium]|nr:helix-turn-helix transcriptional regulator [Acidimicrobiales bacterium]
MGSCVVNHNTTSRLRRWRIANEVTLEDLSGLTGLSQPLLSRVERGERRLKPLDRVRVARAVGEPVGALFEPEFTLTDPGHEVAS